MRTVGQTERGATELSSGDSFTTPWGETITVSAGTVKSSLGYLRKPDSPAVHAQGNRDYVFAKAESSYEEDPSEVSRDDFAVVVDGTKWETTTTFGPVPHHRVSQFTAEIAPLFDPEDDNLRLTQRQQGGIGAPVRATGATESVGLAFDAGEESVVWYFGQDAVSTLTNDPDFSVVGLTVTGPVRPDERTPARVTVRNDGDTGVFRASLGATVSDHPRIVQRTVPARETVELDVPVRFPRMMGNERAAARAGSAVTFRLRTAGGVEKTTTAAREGPQ